MKKSSLAKKITVEVPEDLLIKAVEQTQQSVTETVRQGLRLVAKTSVYKALRNQKGKGEFQHSWKSLKEDR